MEPIRESQSIVINRPAAELYAMVADVTRMGEWSPVCKACWWVQGDGAAVGARFAGRNETPERTWETTSEVVAADPGREFAFSVESTRTRWGYTFSPADGGTEVTESWEFSERGWDVFKERFGDEAAANVEDRREKAMAGMAQTLSALKAAAEAT
jgi:hypothetical protein